MPVTPVLIHLTINGTEREVDVLPGSSLLTLLRDDLGLTGAHCGCGHGAWCSQLAAEEPGDCRSYPLLPDVRSET